MSKLRIATNLSLDLDAVTKTFAILAQRRKGKTYTASVIAEEMVKAKQPWVALDPTGAWWGLRAGADGKPKGGLPVYVFGGQHGDVPLERTAGKLIADLVVDEPRWYVLDLSAFESKEAERQFATDFAERFYRRKAKSPDPIHLFVDEADVFVPQRSPSGDQRMLGAFEAIVRRGGIRGIGTTLISQRAAVVNKNVLEQLDALIMLRVVGPNDQKALKTYIEAHGTDAERRELMDSLASLKLGEAWIWEPGSEPSLFERVQIRERRTYNSSATPKAGELRPGNVSMADVDLAALRDRIEDTVEKADADDPKKLRAKIRELEQELAKRPTETETVEVEKVVKVPAFTAPDREVLEKAAESYRSGLRATEAVMPVIMAALDRVSQAPSPRHAAASPNQGGQPGGTAGGSPRERAAGGGRAKAMARPPAQPPEGLTGPESRVLDALAWLEAVGFERPSKIQTGFIAGYRVGKKIGGTYANVLGSLRGAGLLEYPVTGHVCLTDEGRTLATPPDIERTTEGLQAAVLDRLDGPEQRVLQVLIDHYPDALTKQDAGELAGYTVGEKIGGTYANILGRLRSLGLIDYPNRGEVAALPVLFL